MVEDYGPAATRLEEALALFRRLGDKFGIAMALSQLGDTFNGQGDLDRAEALEEEGLALQREMGDAWNTANTLNLLGGIAHQRGDLTHAAALYRESLGLWWGLDDRWCIAHGLAGLATIAGEGGQPRRAARLIGAADAVVQAVRASLTFIPTRQARYDRMVGAVRTHLGDEAFDAARAAGRALPLAEAVAEAMALPDMIAVAPSQPPGPAEQYGLTLRELDVLRLMTGGRSNREIADTLFISQRTASTHVTHILAKLNVGTRAEAGAWAVRHGLA
jgi:DNA-binding CsgD family transcriptional regulator